MDSRAGVRQEGPGDSNSCPTGAIKKGTKNKKPPNTVQIEESSAKKKKGNQSKFLGLFGEDISPTTLKFDRKLTSKLEKNVAAIPSASTTPSLNAKLPLQPHLIPSEPVESLTKASTASKREKKKNESPPLSKKQVGAPNKGKKNGQSQTRGVQEIKPAIAKVGESSSSSRGMFDARGVGPSAVNCTPPPHTTVNGPTKAGTADKWQLIKPTKGGRAQGKATATSKVNDITTENRFSPIAGIATGAIDSPTTPGEKEIEARIAKRMSKIPPIYIDRVKDWASLFRKLKTNCSFPPVARLAGRRTVVQCQSIADFFLTKELLANEKEDFFTYRLESEKKKLFVIRDLPINLKPEDIRESLEEQGVVTVKITQMQTTKPNARQLNEGLKTVPPRLLPLFLVELHDSIPQFEFLSVKYICGLKIRIEKHRPPKGPPQCHRCQLFGHTDKACHMPPRCVKCGENHLTANCTKKAGEAAVCANCKGSHPASYRGCPSYEKLKIRLQELKLKSQNKIQNSEIKNIPLNTTRTPKATTNRQATNLMENRSKLTYADIARNNKSSNETNQLSNYDLANAPSPEVAEVILNEEKIDNDHEDWRSVMTKWISHLALLIVKPGLTKTAFISHVINSTHLLLNE
ncbi:hypothetical protein J437_LFUL019335 [Ladona fulva]|uniref:Pre-C2HC domain-containing protein n=1 Tax=Ladona fulva TaxID=123851 RepID=A0A8K0KSN5_LADFU|nr:hypothetical protein J437_LFUL019335 [Ladona fulva]